MDKDNAPGKQSSNQTISKAVEPKTTDLPNKDGTILHNLPQAQSYDGGATNTGNAQPRERDAILLNRSSSPSTLIHRARRRYRSMASADNKTALGIPPATVKGRDYQSCDDAIHNASAAAFQRAFELRPRLDPRQVPGTARYIRNFGRLSPPPAEDYGPGESNVETLTKGSHEIKALSKTFQGPDIMEHSDNDRVTTDAAATNERSVKLSVKLDQDTSSTDIIVSANISLSTSFHLSKELWGGEAAHQDLKEVVRKKLQLYLKDYVRGLKLENGGDSELWEQ